MTNKPERKPANIRRIVETASAQIVLLSTALAFTWSLIDNPGQDLLYALLFVGGLYAVVGACVCALKHGLDDRDDYWGKQLVLGGAFVVFIGAAIDAGAAENPAVYRPFLSIGALLVVSALFLKIVQVLARWLNHRPAKAVFREAAETARRQADRS